MSSTDRANTTLGPFWGASVTDAESVSEAEWEGLLLCMACGCCSIGRIGTCVGGCRPRGGQTCHDERKGAAR